MRSLSVLGKCEDSLATPLPYSSFTSSSVFGRAYGAGYAKLNRKQGAGGWSPLVTDRNQWLQVDLGSRKQVFTIVTQGRYGSSDWTSKYRLLYSETQKNWRPYLQDGNIWTFEGNVNSEGVVRHKLQHPILARYIRFIPVDWSREGRIGVRLELYGCSYWADVISFDGHGVISYRFRIKKMKIAKDVISLKFRTTASNGVLVYGEGQQGDYISLELSRARLQLSINLGSNQYGSIQGHTSVTSGSLLDDDHWHSVVIERYRRNVNFTLDHHTQQFRTNGEFDHLDLDYEINFGGLPVSVKPSSGGRENFVGCMEGITYNGDNITNLVRRKKVDTSSFRNLTFSCAESNSFSVFFNSTSFLRLPGQSDGDTLSVSLSFRTWNPNGLLMFTALADGWVEVGLTEGKVTVYMNVTQKKNTRIDISSGSSLNDGQWHSVHLNALENYAMLTVDGDEASTVRTAIPIQIQTGGTYFFGGYFLHTNTRSLQRSFQGCMQMIHIDNHLADLRAVEQGLIGTFENISLDMCAIIDSSGSYWIDPDGSGSVAPFRVNCDMTEKKVWTTLKNNLSPQTSVSSADQEGKAVLQITYNVTDEQVLSVTSNAEYCEQYVAYACRMSRLLNTPGGSVVSFSFDVGSEQMELSVHSPGPLNDDQWHRVEAEKNIKEAVLQLNGHLHTSAVPGASSGQRGFLGCMRALKINGVTFDLEERAKVTPGVNPGCQGHCSNYGMHCRSGGKCVEQYNGYSCDCSLTAYDGPFCTDDVGGYFETGTLVRYDFLPEARPFALREVKSPSGVGVPNEANLTQEELVFSFSTSSAPSILVYISSRTQDYVAVVLRHNEATAPAARWSRPSAGADPPLEPTRRWSRPAAGTDPPLEPAGDDPPLEPARDDPPLEPAGDGPPLEPAGDGLPLEPAGADRPSVGADPLLKPTDPLLEPTLCWSRPTLRWSRSPVARWPPGAG
ncbi:Contactin-associated protein-like 2 [Collichthys lucidus]|uniref:Contactin-associated protein-like 2 n=1 Tax=Collichthys lucidus TaxID=240159 RepID=A0A4U5UYK6_COLLU|nr:Contactin-associated protein-like 2 [Collichthys lucidus]